MLHVPGVVTGADAPPFVRAVARTCTWTVRPCCRRLSLSAFRDLRSSLRPRSGIVAAIRIPLPRIEDDRDAPLTGAGWRRRYKSYREDQEQNANNRPTIFSENQKRLSAATTPKVALAWLNMNSSRFRAKVMELVKDFERAIRRQVTRDCRYIARGIPFATKRPEYSQVSAHGDAAHAPVRKRECTTANDFLITSKKASASWQANVWRLRMSAGEKCEP